MQMKDEQFELLINIQLAQLAALSIIGANLQALNNATKGSEAASLNTNDLDYLLRQAKEFVEKRQIR
jgi:hypothetical protein